MDNTHHSVAAQISALAEGLALGINCEGNPSFIQYLENFFVT